MKFTTLLGLEHSTSTSVKPTFYLNSVAGLGAGV